MVQRLCVVTAACVALTVRVERACPVADGAIFLWAELAKRMTPDGVAIDPCLPGAHPSEIESDAG